MLNKLSNLTGRVRKSKDGIILTQNFAYLSVLQIAGYIFPLITLPYLARVIGLDSFGEIAFAASIVGFFETITVFGFNYIAVRDIAKIRDDIDKASQIFWNVIYSKFLLMAISLIIFSICIYAIPYLHERRLILWLTFLYIPGHIMFPDWFFQAFEKMKYITIMNVLSKLLFTILVFIVITGKSDYIYQPLLNSLGIFISGAFALWFITVKLHLRFYKPVLKEIFITIKNNSNMFISLFLPNLYTNFSVILLGFLGGATSTGIYTSGKKFIDLLEQFSSVLSRTFFPFLARRIEKHRLYVKISMFISILSGIILFLGADLLVNIFYTADFKDAATVIRIMSVAPFFLFLMNTFGINYLVLTGREDILRNIILVCSISGFIIVWFAVINFDFIGVSITVTFVWGIRGLLTWYYAKKKSSN